VHAFLHVTLPRNSLLLGGMIYRIIKLPCMGDIIQAYKGSDGNVVIAVVD